MLTGRQTDKDGRVKLWWSNETLSRYLEGAKCFVDQYSNFTFPEFAGTEAYHVTNSVCIPENTIVIHLKFRSMELYHKERILRIMVE